jgi:hypothetical protein
VVAGHAAPEAGTGAQELEFPPITEIAVGSMILVVIGGIYIASYVPRTVPLGLPVALLAGATLLLLANIVTLGRLTNFAWNVFFQVFGWTLLAYAVIAGMIGYVFVVDGVRGRLLVILVSMLLIYAVDIPMLLSFSVARYQDIGDSA